jgi:hypothetical protein
MHPSTQGSNKELVQCLGMCPVERTSARTHAERYCTGTGKQYKQYKQCKLR